MKKTILKHLTVTGYVEGIDLHDSNLLAKNLADAKEKMGKEKRNVQKAKIALQEALKDSLKKIKKQKESEKKVGKIEKIITGFEPEYEKEKNELKAQFTKMVGKLIQTESEMKLKLEKYKTKGKGKLKSFKRELNKDMNGIEEAIKDFMVDNKNKVKKLAS